MTNLPCKAQLKVNLRAIVYLRTSRFYDLVATRAWPELSPRLAMRFGGAASLEEIEPESFVRFAANAGMTVPYVRRRAGTVARAVGRLLDAGLKFLDLLTRSLSRRSYRKLPNAHRTFIASLKRAEHLSSWHSLGIVTFTLFSSAS